MGRRLTRSTQIAPDKVQVYLRSNGYPDAVVQTLTPYTLNLHVKDFTIERVSSKMGFILTGSPAGEGRLNLPWLLERLGAAGRDLNAILETWPPFGPTLKETIARERAWVETSVRNLRKLIPD